MKQDYTRFMEFKGTGKVIDLPGGFSTIIDEEDYNEISLFKWKTLKTKKKIYVVRSMNKPEKDQNNINKQYVSVLLHRQIMKCGPDDYVDHINGNSLDNRKSNLRVCSNSCNLSNRSKQSNNKSGYKGVIKRKDCNRFEAAIRKDNYSHRLGLYKTIKEAAIAYDLASLYLYKEFAYLNFPENREKYLESMSEYNFTSKSYYNADNYKSIKSDSLKKKIALEKMK